MRFAMRVAMDGEPAVLPSLGTLVREAKKVESFRPALAASFTSFDRIAAELDQTRLPFVQFQAKLGKPRAEFLQTRRRLAVVLETDHEVIRITHHHHIAAAAVSSATTRSTGQTHSAGTRSKAAVKSPILAASLRSSLTTRLLR